MKKKNTILPILKIRQLLGKTQMEVSQNIGFHRCSLSQLESGKNKASTQFAEELAKYYEYKITEMEILYPERYQDKWEKIYFKEDLGI